MYEREREIAVSAAAEACELGRRVQEEVVAAGDALTKGDRSPVTMADLAIQAVISRRLAAVFPADPLLAEEESAALEGAPEMASKVLDLARSCIAGLDTSSLNAALDRGGHDGEAERYWVLDPVDGTKGFLRGEHYAVALALVDHGEVVLGVLGCPNLELSPATAGSARGCLFTAVRGAGTTVRAVAGGNEHSVHVDANTDPSQAVLCESVEAAHAAHSVHARIAERLKINTEPYRIDSQCKYAVVARGEASIYLRLPRSQTYREKVWDHAAGVVVIEEAGGRVSDLDGSPLDFSAGRHLRRQRGIIVTNGTIHEQVLEAARLALGESD